MGLEITSVDVATAWVVLVVVVLVVTVIAAFAVEALAELGPQTRPVFPPRVGRGGRTAAARPGWVSEPPGPGIQTSSAVGPAVSAGTGGMRGRGDTGPATADDTAELDPVGAELDEWEYALGAWPLYREVCG